MNEGINCERRDGILLRMHDALFGSHSGGTLIEGSILIRFQIWCAYLAMAILSVAFSAVWLDKPVAHFVDYAFGRPETFGRLVSTPSLYSPLAILVLLAFILRRIAFRPFGKFDVVLIQSEFSIMLAMLIVPPMKFMFGRTCLNITTRRSLAMMPKDSISSMAARPSTRFLRGTQPPFVR